MQISETEAHSKLCPFTQTNCVAARCMAWRSQKLYRCSECGETSTAGFCHACKIERESITVGSCGLVK